jgi:Na+-transporting NADH:ubiquinone oxidoreductase subunit NqrC
LRLIKEVAQGLDAVVNRLIDADRQARSTLDDANQYYAETLLEIEAEKKRLTESYSAKLEARLKDISGHEYTAIQEALIADRDRAAVIAGEIDKAYESNHSRWEDELFARCVNPNGAVS